MVVLATGMVPNAIPELVDSIKLPTGEDRFLQEVHPKLRPVEVSVNGVLLAGTAQGPMDIRETLSAAGAAAVKAAAMFAHEDVELNPYVAEVDRSLCDGDGAVRDAVRIRRRAADGGGQVEGERTVRRAQVNPGLCVGCGACVAVCPHRAIQVNGWRLDQFEAMVDGIVARRSGERRSEARRRERHGAAATDIRAKTGTGEAARDRRRRAARRSGRSTRQ